MGANPWSQAAVTGASAFASGFYAEYERSVQISARYEMVSETVKMAQVPRENNWTPGQANGR